MLCSPENTRELAEFLTNALYIVPGGPNYRKNVNIKKGLQLALETVIEPYRHDEYEQNARNRLGLSK